VAIKEIDTIDLEPKDVEHAEREIRALKELRHKNIVQYRDDFRDDLVMSSNCINI